MFHRFTKLCLTMAAVMTVFTSCKKEFSEDNPFPDEFTPTVFIGSQNEFLYALDPQTGAKKWEFKAKGNIQASPLVMGENLYIASEEGTVYKLDAKRGSLKKEFTFSSGPLRSTPVGEGDFIYYGSGDGVYAIDVNADTLEWIFATSAPVYSSPVIYDTLCLFGTNDGKVYAVDRIDEGDQVWEYNAGAGQQFHSSPAIGDTLLFIGSSDVSGSAGSILSLHLLDGTLNWAYPTGGAVLSSPVVYGGNVVVGSNDYKLYCLDIISGLPRWQPLATGDRVVSSPYVHNQIIYFGSYDYKMYAVNIIDGSLFWEATTKAIIKSSPMVYDNKLYFGSHDKFLYCLDLNNGNVIWQQLINGLIECSPAVDNLDGKSSYTSTISGNSPY